MVQCLRNSSIAIIVRRVVFSCHISKYTLWWVASSWCLAYRNHSIDCSIETPIITGSVYIILLRGSTESDTDSSKLLTSLFVLSGLAYDSQQTFVWYNTKQCVLLAQHWRQLTFSSRTQVLLLLSAVWVIGCFRKGI